MRFCTLCGTEVPELGVAAPPGPSTSLLAPAPVETIWEPSDVTFFAAGVDLMLARMKAPALSDKERSRIDTRTAVMANKYFRPGGRWKDEILWVSSWAPSLITAAYIRWVVAPAREREAAEEKQQPRTPPNLETVK